MLVLLEHTENQPLVKVRKVNNVRVPVALLNKLSLKLGK